MLRYGTDDINLCKVDVFPNRHITRGGHLVTFC